MVDEERSLRKLMILAPTIRDHKDLETKLTSAPPHLREIIYEAVKPFLRFKARPLDRYIISAKQMAERERLPTMDNLGNLHEFQTTAIGVSDHLREVKEVGNALMESVAQMTLTLVCGKCTRKKEFYGFGRETNVDVVMKARAQGWVYDYTAEPQIEICPECPTSLRKFDA